MSTSQPIEYEVVIRNSDRVLDTYNRLGAAQRGLNAVIQQGSAFARATNNAIIRGIDQQIERTRAAKRAVEEEAARRRDVLERARQAEIARATGVDSALGREIRRRQEVLNVVKATAERSIAYARRQYEAALSNLEKEKAAQSAAASRQAKLAQQIQSQYAAWAAAEQKKALAQERGGKAGIAAAARYEAQIKTLVENIHKLEQAEKAAKAAANQRGVNQAQSQVNRTQERYTRVFGNQSAQVNTAAADLQRAQEMARRRTEAINASYNSEAQAIERTRRAAQQAYDAEIQRLRDRQNAHRRVIQDIEAEEQRVQRLINTYRNAGQAMQQVGAAIRNAGLAISATLTAPIVLASKSGIEFNNLRDTAVAAFTSLTGSAETANGVMSDLYEFAVKTPFEFKNVTSSAQKLAASGIAMNQVGPILESIGEAAAIAAASGGNAGDIVERLSFSFAKMSARGKVQQATLRSFVAAGIPVYELLAKAISEYEGKEVTVQEVNDRIQKGMIDSKFAVEALTKGIKERFGGAMEGIRRTVPGAMAELNDRWDLLMGSILKPLTDVLPPLINRLSNFLKTVQDTIDGLTESQKRWILIIGGTVAAIGPLLVILGTVLGFAGHIATGIASLGTIIVENFGVAAFSMEAFKKAALSLAAPVAAVAFAIAGYAQLVYDNWNIVKAGYIILVDTFRDYWNSKGGSFIDTMKEAWKGFQDFFAGVWAAIMTVFQAVFDQFVFFFMEHWGAIKTTVTGVLGFIMLSVRGLLAFFREYGPIIWEPFLAGLALMKTQLQIFWAAVLGLIGFFLELINGNITDAFSTIARTLGRLIGLVFGLLGDLWRRLKSWLGTIWELVKDSVVGLFSWLFQKSDRTWGEIFSSLWSAIKNAIPNAIAYMKNLGSSMISAFWEGYEQGKPAADEYVKHMVIDSGTERRAAVSKDAYSFIGDPLGNVDLGATGDTAPGAADKAKKKTPAEIRAEGIERAMQKVTGAVDQGRAAFETFEDKAVEALENIFGGIRGPVDDWGSMVKQSLRDVGVSLDDFADPDTYTGKLNKITAAAYTDIENFKEKFKTNSEETAAYSEQVWKRSAYARLAVLQEAAKDEVKIRQELTNVEDQVDAAKIYGTKIAAEYAKLTDESIKFTNSLKGNPLFSEDEIVKLGERFQEANDKLFNTEQASRYAKIAADIEKDRKDFSDDINTREQDALSARIAAFRIATADQIKDGNKVNELVQKYAEVQTAISAEAKRRREADIAFEERRLQISTIYDDVERKRQERELQYRELIEDKIRAGLSGDDAKAWADKWKAAQEQLDVNALKKKIEDAVVSPFSSDATREATRQFIDNFLEGGGDIDVLNRQFEQMQNTFGFVGDNMSIINNQFESMRAMANGDVWGGITNGLQAIAQQALFSRDAMGSLFSSIGEGLGNVLAGTETMGSAIKRIFFNLIGDLAIQFGSFLIAYGTGIAWVPGWNLAAGPAIAAGIALTALGTAIKALAGGSGGSSAAASPAADAGGGGTGGSGSIESRAKKPERLPFSTSGENTIAVNFNGTSDDAPLTKMFMRHMEKNGAVTVTGGRNKQRNRNRRNRSGR